MGVDPWMDKYILCIDLDKKHSLKSNPGKHRYMQNLMRAED